MKVSDVLIQRLDAWGVEHVFGLPGDGVNGFMAAFDRAENRPEFVQAPHEELAAFMACGYAKYAGRVGVCMAPAGPGAIHLLNGLYDAKLDHQPVVAIIGLPPRPERGQPRQTVDLPALFNDVAGAFLQTLERPAQARELLDRALRVALAERTVACLFIPHETQEADAVAAAHGRPGATQAGAGYAPPVVVPAEDDLRRAADVLNAGQRVALLVGAGALNATDLVIDTAEQLGAGIAKALLGKAVVPDDLTNVTGAAGWLGTTASNTMLRECDTLLMIGTSFPYAEFLPQPGQARGVQIDIDPRMLSLRYPMEVNLVGDSRATLRALLPLLEPRRQQAWRAEVESNVRDWWRRAEQNALRDANPLNPQRVFWELSKRLPADCVLAGDCGSSTVWYARYVKMQRDMLSSLSGTLASMGSAIPYALAAKFAYQDRLVVAMLGDGAMQMNGLNGLISIAKNYQRFSDPRLIAIVLNNRDYSYVTWEQRLTEGHRKFEASQELLDFDYAGYADSLGLRGIRVDAPDAVGDALDEALRSDRPVVFEARTDPDVPVVPPELRPSQAHRIHHAMAEGDVDRDAVVAQLREEGFLPEPPGEPETARG